MSNAEIQAGQHSVEDYLGGAFPNGEHALSHDKLRGELIFEVREGGNWYELSVSEEALADNREQMGQILSEQDAAATLRDRPNARLPFNSQSLRVVPREERRIFHQGKWYLVTRDVTFVSIEDDSGERLEQMPLRADMTQSIHRRHEEEWISDIVRWRGEEQ